MKNPTEHPSPTTQELKEYARYRMYQELKTLKKLARLNEPQNHEDYRAPLCYMKDIVITIQLSWGGDGDGYKLTYRDNELLSGVYYWQDWGVYEEVMLSDNDLELVEHIYAPEVFTADQE